MRRAAAGLLFLALSGGQAPAPGGLMEKELGILRGADEKAREALVEEVLKRGPEGAAALKAAFGGEPADLALEVATKKRTFEKGSVEFAARLAYRGLRAGWAVRSAPMELKIVSESPLGRPVEFEGKKWFPKYEWRTGGGRRQDFHDNTSGALRWLAPGSAWSEEKIAKSALDVGEVAARLELSGWAVRVRVAEAGKRIIPDTILPVALAREASSDELRIFVLPPEAERGAEKKGVRFVAESSPGGIRAALSSRREAYAPKDFGAAWLAVLDGSGEGVWCGPMDGVDREKRTYGIGDCSVIPTPPGVLEKTFPIPAGIPPGTYTALAGTDVLGGKIFLEKNVVGLGKEAWMVPLPKAPGEPPVGDPAAGAGGGFYLDILPVVSKPFPLVVPKPSSGKPSPPAGGKP